MKDLKPPTDDYSYYSYSDLIESMEVEVLARHDDDDYQGDSRLLVRDGIRYGLLTYGWGSCSGCDALEGAGSNLADVTELRDQMWRQIHWEDSAYAMLAYVDGKDWTLDYSHSPEFLDAVRLVLAS